MGRFITHLVLTALALAAAAWIVPGIQVGSWMALAVAALVLGIVNAVFRPILVILTLPLTIVTLGLFYLVLNALLFALVAWVVPGFEVAGLGSAILGTLVVGVVSWFAGTFFEERQS